MWIKSEDGKLFNMNEAYSVQVEDREGGHFVVVIEYSPPEMRSFNLTRRISHEEAKRVLDEIEEALGRGHVVLNLCPSGDCDEL